MKEIHRTEFPFASMGEMSAWSLACDYFGDDDFELAGPDVNGDFAARRGEEDIVIYSDGSVDGATFDYWPPDPEQYI